MVDVEVGQREGQRHLGASVLLRSPLAPRDNGRAVCPEGRPKREDERSGRLKRDSQPVKGETIRRC